MQAFLAQALLELGQRRQQKPRSGGYANSANVPQRIENPSLIPFPGSSDKLTASIHSEMGQWQALVQAAHIDPQ